MLAHPILINRPIVVTRLGTKLCRPSEEVLELLRCPSWRRSPKEDGDVVADSGRRRDPSIGKLTLPVQCEAQGVRDRDG
jgi:arsenate reductase